MKPERPKLTEVQERFLRAACDGTPVQAHEGASREDKRAATLVRRTLYRYGLVDERGFVVPAGKVWVQMQDELHRPAAPEDYSLGLALADLGDFAFLLRAGSDLLLLQSAKLQTYIRHFENGGVVTLYGKGNPFRHQQALQKLCTAAPPECSDSSRLGRVQRRYLTTAYMLACVELVGGDALGGNPFAEYTPGQLMAQVNRRLQELRGV